MPLIRSHLLQTGQLYACQRGKFCTCSALVPFNGELHCTHIARALMHDDLCQSSCFFPILFFLMAAHWCSFLSEKYVLCSWRKMIAMSLLSPCGFYSRTLILLLAPDMRHTSQALATKRYFFLHCHIAKGRNEPTFRVFSHSAAIAFHFCPAAHYWHLFYSCQRLCIQAFMPFRVTAEDASASCWHSGYCVRVKCLNLDELGFALRALPADFQCFPQRAYGW